MPGTGSGSHAQSRSKIRRLLPQWLVRAPLLSLAVDPLGTRWLRSDVSDDWGFLLLALPDDQTPAPN
jgi:hypothetical protein